MPRRKPLNPLTERRRRQARARQETPDQRKQRLADQRLRQRHRKMQLLAYQNNNHVPQSYLQELRENGQSIKCFIMSTSEENFPDVVTVIKTEPETEEELIENMEADEAFEQVFIKEENDELTDFCGSVSPGVDGLNRIKTDGDQETGIPEGCATSRIKQNVKTEEEEVREGAEAEDAFEHVFIKTEEEEVREGAEAEDAFEHVFIEKEEDTEMEFCESVIPGVDELDRIKMGDDQEVEIPDDCAAYHIKENVQDLHLNLHSELPLLAVKKEPGVPHNQSTGDVAEKMRSRFLQILRKQPNSAVGTREAKLPQVAVRSSTEDTTYILPDNYVSDEEDEEDASVKDVRNKLRRSSSTSRVLNRLQPDEEIHGDEYICDICNGGFDKLCVMERHRTSHTPDQSLIHRCKTCGRLFSKISSLRRHEHTHTRHPAVCEDCGCTFKYHSQLRVHRKRIVHRKVKRYTKCELWKWLRETNSN